MTDEQGRFAVTGLEAGVYNLLFQGVPGRPGVTARAVEGLRVRAGADSPADLTLIEGRPLRGIVIDQETDKPQAGAMVGCYGPARPQSGAAVESRTTDEHGQFLFHVPPGEHYVYLMDGKLVQPAEPAALGCPRAGRGRACAAAEDCVSRTSMFRDVMTKAAVDRPRQPAKAKIRERTTVEKGRRHQGRGWARPTGQGWRSRSRQRRQTQTSAS